MGIRRYPVIAEGRALFAELRQGENNLFLFRSTLYRIAAAYAENDLLTATPREEDDFALSFSAYLEKHFAQEVNESNAARAMGYHPRYLSCLIRKNFGVSFRRLLSEYRVRAACPLLREKGKSVTEIYLTVGFESQSSFNRNFKAIMGVTPMAYRQGYRLGKDGHG